jgi:VanZ family protein
MKWVTYIFIVLLILIVIVANLGLSPQFFPFIYQIPWGDKLGHFILMGLLSFLLNMITNAPRIQVFSLDILKISLIVMIIVTIEEFSQLILKYRGFSPLDLIFDYTGIFIFGRFALILSDKQNTKIN